MNRRLLASWEVRACLGSSARLLVRVRARVRVGVSVRVRVRVRMRVRVIAEPSVTAA